MSSSTDTTIMTCANCGKGEESSGDLKACTACKLVKYCNRDCQIAHRPQHKKACKKRAAELHDDELFEDPPLPEDCPICMLPLPIEKEHSAFFSCCGKLICVGCIYAMIMEEIRRGKKKEEWGMCAFCRTPTHSSNEENIERIRKLIDNDGNEDAYHQLACYYAEGSNGMPQDWAKANELLLKAGELGCANAYSKLGNSYRDGMGVEANKKKAKHYWELAAIKGNVHARHNLGALEGKTGNDQRAFKHYILAARSGYTPSLDSVKQGFMAGLVTKHEYGNTLRAYQTRVDEMKSDTRDKAKAMRARRENNG